ncbi:hypothetical protein OUZ56_018514 [Daphnia magna]|uniref:Secreted protein n=1 Tax=Daphnia magna TaxID=35525 RepID=A0ABQ9Z9M9_9CRUS|nr:hypothetical protein OUZ56_018514 [Daphnia magna]
MATKEDMQTLLLLHCFLHSLNPTYPIYAPVCDCNYVKIQGILNIKSPYYCNNEKLKHNTHRGYRLTTRW